jgi:hypothetical protein
MHAPGDKVVLLRGKHEGKRATVIRDCLVVREDGCTYQTTVQLRDDACRRTFHIGNDGLLAIRAPS